MEGEPRGIYYNVFPIPAEVEEGDQAGWSLMDKISGFYSTTAGKIVVGSTIAVGTVAAAVPIGLFAAGFGAGGVVAGSIAAGLQGPAVASGSAFAICQSLGATGAATPLLYGLATPTLGIPYIASLFRRNPYIETDDGINLAARRDICPGEILFDDDPIFQAPWQSSSSAGARISMHLPCLTCGLSIRLTGVEERLEKECSTCTFPICSADCQNTEIHRYNECQYFQSKGINFRDVQRVNLPEIVLAIRVMLTKNGTDRKSRTLWKNLKDMAGDEEVDDQDVSDLESNLIHFLTLIEMAGRNQFRDIFRDIIRIKGLLNKKGCTVFGPSEERSSFSTDPIVPHRSGKYLYKLGSKLKHSCSPNCIWEVGAFPDFKLRIRATVPIATGDILTISRLPNLDVFSHGTIERRKFILGFYGYDCTCPRCEDSTELQSFSSALKCPTCFHLHDDNKSKTKIEAKNDGNDDDAKPELPQRTENSGNSGYFLPIHVNPTVFNAIQRQVFWKCNGCGQRAPLEEFYGRVQEIYNELERYNPNNEVDFNFEEAEGFYTDFIPRHGESGNFLHPNHWLIQEAAFRLVFVVRLHRLVPSGNPGGENGEAGENRENEAREIGEDRAVSTQELDENIRICEYLWIFRRKLILDFPDIVLNFCTVARCPCCADFNLYRRMKEMRS